MIAATNRLRDYPTRIVYQETNEPQPGVPLVWFGLGVLTAAFWVFAVIGMGTVAGWMV